MPSEAAPTAAPVVVKSKRTRTGCLTCRARHLKCDEALPQCQNCVKSKKECRRGVRLNFIDMHVQDHVPCLAPTAEWYVAFHDESRDIASEYEGGKDRYAALRPDEPVSIAAPTTAYDDRVDPHLRQQSLQHYDLTHQLPPAPVPAPQALPPPPLRTSQLFTDNSHGHLPHLSSADTSPFSTHPPGMQNNPTAYVYPDPESDSSLDDKRELLKDAQEVLYMQVFCEEVGIWMDSMDPMKHFSRLLPFHSLTEPMLRNAFLACGARHLTLVNPIYTQQRALLHYDTATRHLLKNLQDPDRDTVVCATTAVILNVYEIMCERALPRMNHIAGARALIKECGWNAKAVGVGAACFWLNVGLEVLSCLHFKWQAAWDPDEWGVDMDWSREIQNGREEMWTHRMLYIVAKVSNFRATIPKHELPDHREEQLRLQSRYDTWLKLNELADLWNNSIPRTMHPMAYIYPEQTSKKSAFPEVWLVKRTTIVARLFYHTVMVLLAQTNPVQPRTDPAMFDLERRHSQMICGISAHVKDRGVASVALRSLAHAAECLTDRREQQEVLGIFTKINRETGWRIAFVFKELKALWGWEDDPSVPTPHITSNSDPTPRPLHGTEHRPSLSYSTSGGFPTETSSPHSQHSASAVQQIRHNGGGMHNLAAVGPSPTSSLPSAMRVSPTTSTWPKMPSGVKNPLFANADFSMPQHPYQNVYVAPKPGGQHQQQSLQSYY